MNIDKSTIYKAFVNQDQKAINQFHITGMSANQVEDVSRCVHNYRRYAHGSGIINSLSYLIFRVTQTAKAVFGYSDWQKATKALNEHVVVNVFFDPETANIYPNRPSAGAYMFMELIKQIAFIKEGLMSYTLKALTCKDRHKASIDPALLRLISWYDYCVRKNSLKSAEPIDKQKFAIDQAKRSGIPHFLTQSIFDDYCPQINLYDLKNAVHSSTDRGTEYEAFLNEDKELGEKAGEFIRYDL